MGSDDKIAVARDVWIRKMLGTSLGACGSPIEELLLFAFLNHDEFRIPETDNESYAVSRGFVQTVPWPNVYVGEAGVIDWESDEMAGWRPMYLFQQVPAPCDERMYRADFALFVADWSPRTHSEEMPRESILLKCAIEVDGHDYHERTKTQASHDKARDRAMQKAGWSVLRFTGSDIYKDADGCVLEVLDFVESKAPWRSKK